MQLVDVIQGQIVAKYLPWHPVVTMMLLSDRMKMVSERQNYGKQTIYNQQWYTMANMMKHRVRELAKSLD